MKKIAIVTLLSSYAAFALAACGGSEPRQGGVQAPTRQSLIVTSECSFESCGSVPSNLSTEPKVKCSAKESDCSWADLGSDDNGSVSYRPCANSECPAKPAVNCPSDTVQSAQQCGSENNAACSWTTTCVPPRVKTPCANPDSCGPVPELAVQCSDGTYSGLVCVTDGKTCFLERGCD